MKSIVTAGKLKLAKFACAPSNVISHLFLKNKTALSLICLLAVLGSSAQKNYFQQEVNYRIEVSLNDLDRLLKGKETIEYVNKSPDTLNCIYMHLWPNAYQDNHTPLAKQLLQMNKMDLQFATLEEKGYINQLDFKVNDVKVRWDFEYQQPDVCKLILNEPLLPGGKIIITTPFQVKIPSAKISRLGYLEDAFMITQWYPKPAVYDKNGWNPMSYLSIGEFYSEYGNYDVSITLPANYVLGATGDRYGESMVAEQEFMMSKVRETEAFIDRYNRLPKVTREDMHVVDSFIQNRSIASATRMKTINFKQSNVHDFAWFADKRYLVLNSEVILPHSKRSVATWAMFTPQNVGLWQDAMAYINDGTFFYSLWNGDYQYKHVTAVDGTISAGGGMEYPNITVIGNCQNKNILEETIVHEVGHNWFYGMLGSNERRNPWMDEGLNSFNEMRFIRTKYPNANLGFATGKDSLKFAGIHSFPQKSQYALQYLFCAHENTDQPCGLPADQFSMVNYGTIVYAKSAILFDYLMNYMGEQNFDAAMQFYFDTWKFKHPQPDDLRKIMEFYSGKNLSWFFDDLINTTKHLDYKIQSFKKNEDGSYTVLVKNTGEINGPLPLCGIHEGKIKGLVWYEGFSGQKALMFPPSEIDLLQIDFLNYMPEYSRHDNSMKLNGMFKHIEPLEIGFPLNVDNQTKTQLNVFPLLTYNRYNNLMVGVYMGNHSLLQKELEFDLIPMFSMFNRNWGGIASVRANMLPHGNKIQEITVGLNARRFAQYEHSNEEKWAFHNYKDVPDFLNYNRFQTYVNIDFKKKHATSHISHHLSARMVTIMKEDHVKLLDDHFNPIYKPTILTTNIGEIGYTMINNAKLSPLKISAWFHATSSMQRISTEWIKEFSVNNHSTFYFRFFAGLMLKNIKDFSENTPDYSFRASGYSAGPNGNTDFMYDHFFMGRQEFHRVSGIAQFTESEGAFKAYSASGNADKWITAMNFKTPTLGKKLLTRFYGFADVALLNAPGSAKPRALMYDAGLAWCIVKDLVEVYLPLIVDGSIAADYRAYEIENLTPKVRFVMNLNSLNPLLVKKKVDL